LALTAAQVDVSEFPARRLSRQHVAWGAILVALTLGIYLQAARFGFIPIDDQLYVTEESHIRQGLSTNGIKWAFTACYDSNWIPLTWVSLMADATLFGSWPGGRHLTNVLLHVVNVLLVFAVFAKATGNSRRSAFVAALFAVHPLHVESVAWIAERKDVLSILFGLAALYSYVSYSRKPRIAAFFAALVCYVCSLLSKQTLVTFPFVLLLLDYWPLCRIRAADGRGRIGRLIAEKLPFFAISALFCAIELRAQVGGRSTRTLAEFPLWTRCLNAVLAYALYLKKALLPFDLAPFYPHPGVALNVAALAAAFAILATVTLFAIINVRRRPFLIVGWLWFLGALVPMIGIVQVGIQQMADRYTYFPMLGLYAACAWLVPSLLENRLGRWRDRLLPALAVGIVGCFAAVAFVQVGYWRDGVTVIRHTQAVTRDNPFVHVLLGNALYVNSRVDEALEQFQQALRMAPDDPEQNYRLGWVYQDLKRYDEAAEQYRASLAVDEQNPLTHIRLGWVLWAQHQHADAAREFKRAVELDDKYVVAYLNLAGLSRAMGDFRQSIAYCERGLAADPGSIDCRRLVAFNLRDQGRLDEATDQFRAVLATDPNDEESRSELAHIESLRVDRPDLVGRAN
jgi:protein O-mannosyl-transferase